MEHWQELYDLKMEQDMFVGMTLSVCVGVIDETENRAERRKSKRKKR